MRQPPEGLSIKDLTADVIERDEVEKTLDLADWERDIVYDSL